MDPVAMAASLAALIVAVCCGVAVYRLDRQCYLLLPRQRARRWAENPGPLMPDIADLIRHHVPRLFPPHWQPELHSGRGLEAVARLHLFLGLTCILIMLGCTLLAKAVVVVR